MNDVRPGMLLYKPVYKVMITKVIIQNLLLLWLKLKQAKFELFSQKLLLSYMCKAS